jgi:hypothetical protein
LWVPAASRDIFSFLILYIFIFFFNWKEKVEGETNFSSHRYLPLLLPWIIIPSLYKKKIYFTMFTWFIEKKGKNSPPPQLVCVTHAHTIPPSPSYMFSHMAFIILPQKTCFSLFLTIKYLLIIWKKKANKIFRDFFIQTQIFFLKIFWPSQVSLLPVKPQQNTHLHTPYRHIF